MYPNEWYGAAAKTGEERSAQQWITDMGIFYSSCHKVLVVIHIDGTTCRNNLNHCKARLAINQWIRRKALSNPYQRQHHHQLSQAQSLVVNQRKKFFFDNFIDNSCRAMSADVANYVRRAVSIWDKISFVTIQLPPSLAINMPWQVLNQTEKRSFALFWQSCRAIMHFCAAVSISLDRQMLNQIEGKICLFLSILPYIYVFKVNNMKRGFHPKF